MTIMIRRADYEDATPLTALMHASSAYQGDYATILRDYGVTPAQIDTDIVFLAEADGALAGFYSLIVTSEPELDLMFVADAMHGRGIGRLLIAHMSEQARALAIPSIRIVAHPPAQAFYESVGAKRVGTKPRTATAGWERPILALPIAI